METTFGNPQYVFPDRNELIDGLVDCIQQIIAKGEVPLIYAYALGKAH